MMKNILTFLFLVLGYNAMAQIEVGISGAFSVFHDFNQVMYIDKSLSFGGELGISLSAPLMNKKLAIETGLLFHDNYYRLRGPKYSVWFNEKYGSSFKIHENINDYGVSFPIAVVFGQKGIQPFIGTNWQFNISPDRIFEEKLGGISVGNPIFFEAIGWNIIELSKFTWYFNAGSYFKLLPKLRLKLNYALGMNDFVTHSISPKIINGVNESGTTVQTSRIQKFLLSAVYSPDWKNIGKKPGKPKRTVKERLKELYQ